MYDRIWPRERQPSVMTTEIAHSSCPDGADASKNKPCVCCRIPTANAGAPDNILNNITGVDFNMLITLQMV